MTYLTLNQIKHHLNLDYDEPSSYSYSYINTFDYDDDYLTSLGDVAEMIVQKHLECDLSTLAADNGGTLPAPVVHAMLLFVGNLYMNRESVSVTAMHQIPMAFEYLIGLYKNYDGFKG